jgi:hypothetical protein
MSAAGALRTGRGSPASGFNTGAIFLTEVWRGA